jgi:hypothetical protein
MANSGRLAGGPGHNAGLFDPVFPDPREFARRDGDPLDAIAESGNLAVCASHDP